MSSEANVIKIFAIVHHLNVCRNTQKWWLKWMLDVSSARFRFRFFFGDISKHWPVGVAKPHRLPQALPDIASRFLFKLLGKAAFYDQLKSSRKKTGNVFIQYKNILILMKQCTNREHGSKKTHKIRFWNLF